MEERVTVVVVPRERFSYARRSLESVLENTREPYRLVYVDAGTPRGLRRYLERTTRERGFKLVRTPHLTSNNRSRNLALAWVTTPYVVFIDNDVVVAPGWLEKLVACADETDAALVGPLYMMGEPGSEVVHMAGGELSIEPRDGRMRFHESHRFLGRKLADVKKNIRREPVAMLEFHCMLARKSVLDQLGPLDEKMLSHCEHIDLCLTVSRAGGEIWLEPESVITYVYPPPFGRHDRRFYLLRWCDEWNRHTCDHFARKYSLPDDDPALLHVMEWLIGHRMRAWRTVRNVFALALGRKRSLAAARWIDRLVAQALVARDEARSRENGVIGNDCNIIS